MGYGFIRKPEDIKCLILYCFSLLPFAISDADAYELASIDGGFDYFEYAQAFAELVEAKHISSVETSKGNLYTVTPSGLGIINVMIDRLPPSVRDRADYKAIEITRKIRRERSIRTSHVYNEQDDSYKVHLALVAKGYEQFAIDVTLYSERQCNKVENVFRKEAENIYASVLDQLAKCDD